MVDCIEDMSFHCEFGDCIDKSKVCDFHNDCPLAEDEGPVCGESKHAVKCKVVKQIFRRLTHKSTFKLMLMQKLVNKSTNTHPYIYQSLMTSCLKQDCIVAKPRATKHKTGHTLQAMAPLTKHTHKHGLTIIKG